MGIRDVEIQGICYGTDFFFMGYNQTVTNRPTELIKSHAFFVSDVAGCYMLH